jgi:hypothetical protein
MSPESELKFEVQIHLCLASMRMFIANRGPDLVSVKLQELISDPDSLLDDDNHLQHGRNPVSEYN